MYSMPEKLKKLRLEKRLKQYQVAEIVGVNASVISAYESGLRQPSYDVLLKLANLYHVSLDYLFGRDGGKTVDLTGLSKREVILVRELIAEFSGKNTRKKDAGDDDLNPNS